MILSGGWWKEEQGAPCQAWQSLEGPLEVLPRSSGAQHPLSRSLGLYCLEKAQEPGNWAPGRKRWGCRKQSGQCRLRGARWDGYKLGWAAARMPWLASPRSLPPAGQPQSSQGRGGPCGPSPVLGAGDWPWTGLGTPLRSTRGGGCGSCPGRGPEGREDSSQQQGLVPPARAPRRLPHTTPHSPQLTQLGPGLRGSRQGWRWPQGLRRPLPPLEGLLRSAEACSVRWE